MIEPVREWLPANLVSIDRINTALSPCLHAWSADWLARSAASPDVRLPALLAFDALEHAAHFSGAHHIRLALPAIGKRYLLEALLDESLAGKALTPTDYQLLDGLAGRAMNDLAERLGRLFQAQAATDPTTQELAIDVNGHEICRMLYPVDGMAILMRQEFVRTASSAIPLVSRRHALAACAVEVDAILGSVRLTVDDLHDLEIGDVLVLDRPLEQAVDLRLAATRSVIASGHPTVLEDRNAIGF